MKLLLAEDNDLQRAELRALFEASGHQVTEAVTRRGALIHLQSHVFDFILTDLQMPIGDGGEIALDTGYLIVQCARALERNDPKRPKAKIWLTSAGLEGHIETMAKGAGANEAFSKRVLRDRLKQAGFIK